jgi:hypothetical protein
MSKVQNGIVVFDGPNGPVCDLCGVGAPSAQTMPTYAQSLDPIAVTVGTAPSVDVQSINVSTCAIGSTWRDIISGHQYNKTSMTPGPLGTWNLAA